MAAHVATESSVKAELEQVYDGPAATKSDSNAEKLQLHRDGVHFVMPMRRGIDPTAPGFDPEDFLDLLAEDVMYIQHEKLREILEVQANVEYLQRHGLNGRTDVESFRKCVPVVSYGDLEDEIMRLVNGEKNPILSVDPIISFNFSSGTTGGKPKFIPSTARAFENYMFIQVYVKALYRRDFPGYKDGKALSLAFAGKQMDTPAGIKAGAMSTNYFRGPRFRDRVKDPNEEYCVPDEVILCNDTNQGMYCHLLCALAQAPAIVKVYGTFAASIVAAVRALQKQWPEIVEDIRTGTLNKKITEPEMRVAVEKMLQPNPDLASRIEKECSKEKWEGIIPRLFPKARFVACVISGSMLQYAPALKHFSGHLSMISPVYAACECAFIGLNPNMKCAPEDITYMLWPETAYYEFIPLDDDGVEQFDDGENLKLLEACDLEVGKQYELVITNVIGLYRYRIGDVIRVKSFRKTAPVYEFVRRKNVILSVHTDKTDEEELQAVVNKASELLAGTAMELSDYTSTVDVTSLPGRYVIFWEMTSSSNLDHDVLQRCANKLDESFNNDYRRWRSGNQIGPLELSIVREGTFDKVMHSAVGRGASPSQYKPPRCVNHSQALEIIKAGVEASFLSTSTPEATPSGAIL
ncbi:hypothetical protein M758_10G060100 [Ceratodon purpureus]|nr:hypothetical protein M758_10G060100 [Ceratodon purpureus]KAG0603028.1 hypothetical protein M758_10G060100 [Ceratodon purpureus]